MPAVGQENFCLCVDVFIYAAFLLMIFTDSSSISRVQISSLSFPLFAYFYDTRAPSKERERERTELYIKCECALLC